MRIVNLLREEELHPLDCWDVGQTTSCSLPCR